MRLEGGTFLGTFDLSAKSYAATTGVSTGSITQVTSDWYLCTMTVLLTSGAGSSMRIYLGSGSFAGDASTVQMYFAFTQLEAKAYKTSWQEGGTPRTEESLLYPDAGAVTTVGGGTINLWAFIVNNANTDVAKYFIEFNAGATANRISLVKNATNDSWSANTYNAASATSAHNVTDLTMPNGWQMLTMTWSATELALWVNGVKQANPTANPFIPEGNVATFGIGNRASASSGWLNNTIPDQMRFFNRVLTAAEVAQLYRSGR
jgi:hypothetical protein